jgi:hypothetical protein
VTLAARDYFSDRVKSRLEIRGFPPFRKKRERMGHGKLSLQALGDPEQETTA